MTDDKHSKHASKIVYATEKFILQVISNTLRLGAKKFTYHDITDDELRKRFEQLNLETRTGIEDAIRAGQALRDAIANGLRDAAGTGKEPQ